MEKKVEELTFFGVYKNNYTKLNTKNSDLILELKNGNISLNVNGYDVIYQTEDKEEDSNNKNINIVGNNSNIYVNDKYKFLADNFEVRVRDNEKFVHLQHKNRYNTKISKDNKVDIFTNEISDEYVNAIFDKNIFKGGKILFLANGNLDNLNGKVIIENSNIEDLAIINNLLIFIHTSCSCKIHF